MVMTDASMAGARVTEGHFSQQEVYDVAKFDERWRFKLEYRSKEGHRARAFRLAQADLFKDIETVLAVEEPPQPEWAVRRDFPDVSPSMSDSRRWRAVVAYPWKRREGIHVLEVKAVLFAVRRYSRALVSHNQKCSFSLTTCRSSLPCLKGVLLILDC